MLCLQMTRLSVFMEKVENITWAPSCENVSSEIFDQVWLKPVCSATATSYSLEISDIETRGINYLGRENKGADQTAQIRRLICTFVVRIWHKTHFRMTWLTSL